jgi:excisionase family DNA binding protein
MTASSRAGVYTALCLVLLTGGIVSLLSGSIGNGIVLIALAAVPLVVARASGGAHAGGTQEHVEGEEDLLSVEEVAEMLETSTGSILMLVARDSIPYVAPAAGAPSAAFRFRPADIDEWLRSDPYYVPPSGE